MASPDKNKMALICAATPAELACWPEEKPAGGGNFQRLCTGAGIPLCLSSLFQYLETSRPIVIVNIGIAGAYPGSRFNIGDLVNVTEERFGDLGVEDNRAADGFIPIDQFEFGRDYGASIKLAALNGFKFFSGGPSVHSGKGCTVNTCSGTGKTGALRERLFTAQVESMEGAAVALAGKSKKIPVLQIRVISNAASHRDMKKANVELALERLSAFLTVHAKVILSEDFGRHIALSQ